MSIFTFFLLLAIYQTFQEWRENVSRSRKKTPIISHTKADMEIFEAGVERGEDEYSF